MIFDHNELDKSVAKLLQQRRTARNVKIGAHDVYISISGCRSLSESPRDCFFDPCVASNPRFAVEISTVSVIVTEI